MLGLGTDIIEIDRVRKAMERSRFAQRVFTEQERAWLNTKGRHQAQSAAGLFCAKEAVAKALGTGFGVGLRFRDIEICHTAQGTPFLLRPKRPAALTISHCETYATATALLLESDEETERTDWMETQGETSENLLRAVLKPRNAEANKNDFGRVMAFCGCRNYIGAAYFAAQAAVRTGSGVVTLALPVGIYPIVAGKLNEPTYLPLPEDENGRLSGEDLPDISRCGAILVGPGLGLGDGVRRTVEHMLRHAPCPVIVDADGINSLAGHIDSIEQAKHPVVLTPHAYEFARVCDIPRTDSREADAAAFAKKHRCVLLLKGHETVIASPEGQILANRRGNPGMAKGGSGDVLSGIILSLLGQGVPPFEAAACGAYIHSRAGDLCANEIGEFGMTPTDMLHVIPRVLKPLNTREW